MTRQNAGVIMLSWSITVGLLAHTSGDLPRAEAHFRDAMALAERVGMRPEAAWCRCDYADLLLQRDARATWLMLVRSWRRR